MDVGVCKLFAISFIVTSKTGTNGKGAVCQFFGIPSIVDGSDEVAGDCRSRGLYVYQVSAHWRLSVPVERLLE